MTSRSALAWFFNDAAGRQTVFQRPNAPILTWAAASAASRLPLPATGRQLAAGAARKALTVWASLELFKGASPFRRTAGGLTLAALRLRRRKA